MDSEVSIKLFNTDQNDVVLPSSEKLDNSANSGLISESIDKAILGSKVKTLLLPEDTEIFPYNYIFDFSDLESVDVIQKESLKSLVSVNGDTKLYLYKRNSGLTGFGAGDKYTLERMVPLIKQYVFDNQIKVYKNFVLGEKPIEVISKDITKMRLNL